MASNYGRNFGFRRSDESMAIREGRLRTPAAGTFRLGTLVARDPASAGFLKAAAANQVGAGGEVGLLVQEEQFIGSIYGKDVALYDSYDIGVAKNNTLSVIWAGLGTKVWFRNTGAETRADGRTVAAVTMVDFTGLALGDYLTWDGTKFVEGTSANSMLQITAINASEEFLEAVFVR